MAQIPTTYRYFRQIGYLARNALRLARTTTRIRYPRDDASATPQPDGSIFLSDPSAFGLRYVGNVAPRDGWHRGDIWQPSRGRTGWLTDPDGCYSPDGEGLMWGVVYRLPARRGRSRYVAGYTGGAGDGATIEPTIFDDEREAAIRADELARIAAEHERDWQPGSGFAFVRRADELNADLRA